MSFSCGNATVELIVYKNGKEKAQQPFQMMMLKKKRTKERGRSEYQFIEKLNNKFDFRPRN